MLHELLKTWFHLVETWGYTGVVALMALESSIVPVPSEVVIPPAAFWAVQGRMNFWGVILAGTFGSWAGSAISYWVSRAVGMPFLERFGRYLLMPPEKIHMASGWVQRYGAGGIFLARLLPVVRHLISIPAGVLKMPFGVFSLYTIAGAGLWCTVLAWFGAKVLGDQPQLLQSPEAMVGAIKAKLIWFVLGALAFGALYVAMLFFRGRKVASEKPVA